MLLRPASASSLFPLYALLSGVFCTMAQADSFTITTGQTLTEQQTLSTNETGVIDTGGGLNVVGAAVYMPGTNSSMTNNGEILVSGESGFSYVSGFGIKCTSNNSKVVNNGSIVANGKGGGFDGGEAYGIRSSSSVINSGSIVVNNSGFGAGIIVDSATVTNSGSIVTSGDATYGISPWGAASFISNSGSIKTSGSEASGIYVTSFGSFPGGDDIVFANSGEITTTGANADGITVKYWDGGKIANSGTIVALGTEGRGINYAGGSSGTINHSGTIIVSGAGASGIYSDGMGGTLNIRGQIIAAGAATSAIIGDNNQTLNLFSGARILGTVDLGSGTNFVNVNLDGAGPSSTITVDNAGIISQRGQGLSLVRNNSIAIVDTTNLTAAATSLGSISGSIFQAVNQRLNRAAAEIPSDMQHQDPAPVSWGHILGSNNQHSEHGAVLGYTTRNQGLLGGYEQTFDDTRVGLLGGALHTRIDTDQHSSDTDGDNVLAGLYGQITRGTWQFNGAVIAGYVKYDTQRRVTDNLFGEETARADYHGTYLSPSLSATRIHNLGAGLSLRPGVELNYTYSWLGGYSEEGTTNSNLEVSRRQGGVLNSRLQLAMRQELAEHQGGVEFRIGVSRSDYSDEKMKIGLQSSTATNYLLSGTDSVSGGYVGASARIQLKNQLSLVGDLEYQRSSSSDHATVGYAGLEYRF